MRFPIWRVAVLGVLFWGLAFVQGLLADTILMKSGRVIEGEIISQDPKEIKIRVVYGVITLTVADIETIKRTDPEGSILGQARLYLDQKDYRSADKVLLEGLVRFPESSAISTLRDQVLFSRAEYLFSKGFLDKSLEAVDAFLKVRPDAATGVALKNKILEAQGAYQKKQEGLATGLEMGNYKQVIPELRAAIQAHPERTEELSPLLAKALLGLGTQDLEIEDRTGANAAWDEALLYNSALWEQEPFRKGYLELKTTLAKELTKKVNWEGVLDLLLPVLEMDPSQLELTSLAGKALTALNRNKEASDLYAKALGLTGKIPPLSELEAQLAKALTPATGAAGSGTGTPVAKVPSLPASESLISENTQYFTIKYNKDDDTEAKKVIRVVDQVWAETCASLEEKKPLKGVGGGLINFIIYPTTESYRKATSQPEWSGGAAISTWQGDTLVNLEMASYAKSSDLVGAVLPHELMHAALALKCPNARKHLWLNEGLAVAREPRVRLTGHLIAMRPQIQDGEGYSLEDIFDLQSFTKSKLDLGYAECYVTVKFLLTKGTLKDLLRLAETANDVAGIKKGIQDIYKIKDWRLFEEEFSKYLKKQ